MQIIVIHKQIIFISDYSICSLEKGGKGGNGERDNVVGKEGIVTSCKYMLEEIIAGVYLILNKVAKL